MILSKIIFGIIKLTNPNKEAISSLLLSGINTSDNIETRIKAFEKFERDFKQECTVERRKANFVKDTVDCFVPVEKIIHPLEEMEVEYKTVATC